MYVLAGAEIRSSSRVALYDIIPIHPEYQIAVFLPNTFYRFLPQSFFNNAYATMIDGFEVPTPDFEDPSFHDLSMKTRGTYFIFAPSKPPFRLPYTLNRKVIRTEKISPKVTHKFKLILGPTYIAVDRGGLVQPLTEFPAMRNAHTRRTILDLPTTSGRPANCSTK